MLYPTFFTYIIISFALLENLQQYVLALLAFAMEK